MYPFSYARPAYVLCAGLILGFAFAAQAAGKTVSAGTPSDNSHIEVTADKSLEWYQDQRIYVARGNAKAVRGDMTVTGDLLTAHERDTPTKPGKADKTATPKALPASETPVNAETQPASSTTATATAGAKSPDSNGTGDIDKMTAEGNVHVVTSKSRITGDHGVYDLNKHVAYVTGNNLKYQTDQETVTARDSLEYWEDKKLAVARGNAVGVRGDRHVEGDTLLAQFRDMPNGKSEMQTMTAIGNVTVITANDVSRAERAVYDINRNIAILTGNVRITRANGMQLTGDVGEVDFASNQSRLLNEGHGRVRALLTSSAGPKGAKTTGNKSSVSPVDSRTASAP